MSAEQTAGNEARRRDVAAVEEKVAELEQAQQRESVEAEDLNTSPGGVDPTPGRSFTAAPRASQ